jgi:DNA-binding NtrC family response regulator
MNETILLVEDDRELRGFLVEILEDSGYNVAAFGEVPGALGALQAGHCDPSLVITDLRMPGLQGEDLLSRLQETRPELNVIVITAFGSIDSAIAMVKAGAYDYMTKPFGSDELLLVVERALEDSRLRRLLADVNRSNLASLPGLVAVSKPMLQLRDFIQRTARSSFPVMITGESGTGKELVARALHRSSGRGSFVAVNCATLPENLLESELFGHEKGSFTGADRDKPGLFEEADAGTLFLDEIGELPLTLQPKLLRALEEGEIRRIGSTRPRALDVRVIVATNRDLEEEVREHRFREDLFWRLNVVALHVPPLRDRPEDIPLLVEHFLQQSVVRDTPSASSRAGGPVRHSVTSDCLRLLKSYPWPGNVRELRNALERAIALSTGSQIGVADLPPRIREADPSAVSVAGAAERRLSLRDLEKEYVKEVLRQAGGNKTRAAEILGMDRKTLYRKLHEFSLDEEGPAV